MKKLIAIIIFAMTGLTSFAETDAASGRKARNYIVEGKSLYKESSYDRAEVMYRKALEADPLSDVAKFNLAASLLRQRSTADQEAAEAVNLLNQLVKSEVSGIAEKSYYNLGNLAFNKQDYQGSIAHYKNALRKNPDNDKARENLYLAQRMLQQQQDQDQNQQNKDQNQQDKDQNQQDKDRNKDQNQDQNDNKDQNQNKDKDENKDQQQQQDQQQQNQQQQNPQQKSGQLSPENVQQILKAMENEENATRARIEKENAEKAKRNAMRRPVTNPW